MKKAKIPQQKRKRTNLYCERGGDEERSDKWKGEERSDEWRVVSYYCGVVVNGRRFASPALTSPLTAFTDFSTLSSAPLKASLTE